MQESAFHSFSEAAQDVMDFAKGKPCGGSHISASKQCRVGSSADAGNDLKAARERLRAKKAAQRKADSESLKKSSRSSVKADLEKRKLEKRSVEESKRAKREGEIKSLKSGQDVTVMVGGKEVHGKFVALSTDSKGRTQAAVTVQSDGPGWKKGETYYVNADKGWGGVGAPKKTQSGSAPQGLEAWKALYSK